MHVGQFWLGEKGWRKSESHRMTLQYVAPVEFALGMHRLFISGYSLLLAAHRPHKAPRFILILKRIFGGRRGIINMFSRWLCGGFFPIIKKKKKSFAFFLRFTPLIHFNGLQLDAYLFYLQASLVAIPSPPPSHPPNNGVFHYLVSSCNITILHKMANKAWFPLHQVLYSASYYSVSSPNHFFADLEWHAREK